MDKKTVNLTEQEWQIVVNALATQPFNVVAEVINKVVTQVREQQSKQEQ